MPLQMSTTYVHIEENDGSVFIVLPSKKDVVSPILDYYIRQFGRRLRASIILSLCTIEAPYDERNGIWLTSMWRPEFWKKTMHPFTTFVSKGKPTNYYDQTHRELGYTTPPIQSDSEPKKSLPSHSSNSSDWESDVSVGLPSKNSSSTWYQPVKWNQKRTLSHSTPIHRLNNLIFNGKSVLNNATLLQKIK